MVTAKSLENLKLGRVKGLTKKGHEHSAKERLKRSNSLKKFFKLHPEVAEKRGLKMRAEKHYLWKGGISNLNQSIRQMGKYRNWQRKMKKKYIKCPCGSEKDIEIHHLIPLKLLIEMHKITNRDEAQNCKELWSMNNGIGLCRKCHYKIDNRKYNDN